MGTQVIICVTVVPKDSPAIKTGLLSCAVFIVPIDTIILSTRVKLATEVRTREMGRTTTTTADTTTVIGETLVTTTTLVPAKTTIPVIRIKQTLSPWILHQLLLQVSYPPANKLKKPANRQLQQSLIDIRHQGLRLYSSRWFSDQRQPSDTSVHTIQDDM